VSLPMEERKRVELLLPKPLYEYVMEVKRTLGFISIGEALRWIIIQHGRATSNQRLAELIAKSSGSEKK